MSKEKNVVEFYVLCNRLKDVIRTGWKDWKVKAKRVESVAEHIYGTQMLAIAMCKEFDYDIDLKKVILMLAIHELGETVIGDLTMFEISYEEKKKIESQSVHNILKTIVSSEDLEELFTEFEERKTKEALFAYRCDKLECDIQATLYDERNLVDITDQDDNETAFHPDVKKWLDKGYGFSATWLRFDREIYDYDENFTKVSEYVEENDIIDN